MKQRAMTAFAILAVCIPPPGPGGLRITESGFAMVVTATAYNSVPSQTDDRADEGAWGHRLEPGMRIIAVSRDLVALGLKARVRVSIEGHPGTYEVLDRLPPGRRQAIDLYFGEDVEAARAWGRRRVEIRWPA